MLAVEELIARRSSSMMLVVETIPARPEVAIWSVVEEGVGPSTTSGGDAENAPVEEVVEE
jgi:hypothetical protein